MSTSFYGDVQAVIHHERFGDLANQAGRVLVETLHANGVAGGAVVDLGSGSGLLARVVSDAGFDVEGVDLSPSMVELALVTAPDARFRQGSVHDAELPPGAVAVTATGEVLNYATDERAGVDALERLAARARAALDPRGVLLFDVATPGRAGPDGVRLHRHEAQRWTMFVHVEEDAQAGTLTRSMDIFHEDAPGAGLYRRVQERHVLRLYEVAEVCAAVERQGFEVDVLDDYGAMTSSIPTMGWKVFRCRPRSTG